MNVAPDIPRFRATFAGVAAFDEADCASNLAVSDPAGSVAKVLSNFTAFADGIGDAFALDLVFPFA